VAIQLENGYTKIANQIFDVLAKTPLNGTQRRIIDVLFRYTYGFNRKEHELSETFISKATVIDKRQVRRELNKLIEAKIILIMKEATFTEPRILTFNKNYKHWAIAKNTTEGILDHSPGDKIPLTTEGELDPQEIQIKYNIKESAHNNFENLWSLYPNKKGKGKISEAQIKKLYSIGIDELTRCIDRYKQSKEEWKAWQQGSTFFNSGYVDYLDANYEEEPKKKTWGWS
jgi:phage replication O-like protein O